ncbi:hypothetical protein ACVW1A_004886 [Bradyrhizobium sp. LB1.3]
MRKAMARRLNTYVTSLGFFQAIAAPSMKAALEAWGADSNLFHQGAARESDDPDVIAATMDKPGVVLKRPVGSGDPFEEHAEVPKNIIDDQGRKTAGRKSGPPKAAKKPNAAARRRSAKQRLPTSASGNGATATARAKRRLRRRSAGGDRMPSKGAAGVGRRSRKT